MNPTEKLFNATCRVESLIWIAGAVADPESLPDSFEEQFIEDLPDRPDNILYQQLPALLPFVENREDTYEIAYALYDTDGFLIQAAAPVKKYHSENGCSYSWGYYRTAWLYAKDADAIADVVLEWVSHQDAKDRAKSAA